MIWYNSGMKTLCVLFFLSGFVCGAEVSESFVVKIHEGYFKVTAPENFDPDTHLTIENETLTKIYGKLDTLTERPIIYVSIFPKSFKSLKVNLVEGGKAIFTPLSPPFQEVELEFGRGSYEIPPQ